MNYTQLGEICNLWRNYGDIEDSWNSVLSIADWFFNNQDVLQPAAGPGRWNDPDMVCLCQTLHFTVEEMLLFNELTNQSEEMTEYVLASG